MKIQSVSLNHIKKQNPATIAGFFMPQKTNMLKFQFTVFIYHI
jgi:hypothetical protein